MLAIQKPASPEEVKTKGRLTIGADIGDGIAGGEMTLKE